MDAYTYKADIYCEECAADIQRNVDTHKRPEYPVCWAGDSDEFPAGPYPQGGGEADTPQHCGGCHAFLENPLTPDGLNYVHDAIVEWQEGDKGSDGNVIQQWERFYADQLP